jgi:hypothetical protein
MEGLRLLDESAREGGAEESAEVGAPAPASTATTAASGGGRGRREEEEDVLLDG